MNAQVVISPTRDLIDWLNALSTVAVAVFAVVQVLLVVHADRDRRRAAYDVIWAEWNRLMQLAQQWDEEDLVVLAEHGVLNPADTVPADWPLLSQNLAHLGSNAARYGGAAYTFATVAARNCRLLLHLAVAVPKPDRAEAHTKSLRELESKIKLNMNQVVLLLEDAMAVAPKYLRTKKIALGEPQSMLGQALVAEARSQSMPRGLVGRIRSWAARGRDSASDVA